jgi:tetratricopeptide (TPR) repeat protein
MSKEFATMRHYCGLRAWVFASALAVAGLLSLSGCTSSPQTKEAKAIARGKKLLQQKDYARAMLEFKNAARTVQADAEPYFQMALVALETGDARAAYQMLKKAIELNPQHLEAKSRLARLIAEKGNNEKLSEAENTAKAILALAPDNVENLYTLGILEFRLGNRGDAEQYLDQALAKVPSSFGSSVLLAKVKMSGNDLQGAEKVLKDAVQRSPKSVDAWVALGNFYAVIGRFPDAFQAFETALGIKPQYPLALISLAEAQHRSGQKEKAAETLRQLSTLPDPQYESLYGSYLFQAGNREVALREFERLARKNPKDREARTRLVETYLALGRTSDAEGIINGAVKRNPNDVDALQARSYLYLLQRKYTEAQADLNLVVKYQPRSAEAHFLLSRIHKARGSSTMERQELNEALQIDPGLLSVRLALAANLAVQSPKDALELLDKAPNRQTRDLSFIVERNSCLLAMGRYPELRKSLDQALTSARTPELLVQDGLVWSGLQQYEKARASLKEAVEKRPSDPRVLDLLAQTYIAQKQPGKALDLIRAHAANHPEAAPIQQLLGAWLQRNGKPTEARVAFMAAKAGDSSFVEADLALAILDMGEGKFDAARPRLNAALVTHPADTKARFLLAEVEEATRNYSAAIEHYRRLVDLEPGNVLFLNNLAYDLVEYAKRPDEALAWAQKAKELAPSSPYVADTLGWVYYQKGIYRSAVSQLEAAVSTKSSLAGDQMGRVHYHLAMAYFKSGDTSKGQQVLEAALRLAPALPEAKVAQELRKQSGHQ